MAGAALGDAEDIFNAHAKEWIGGHWKTPLFVYKIPKSWKIEQEPNLEYLHCLF